MVGTGAIVEEKASEVVEGEEKEVGSSVFSWAVEEGGAVVRLSSVS